MNCNGEQEPKGLFVGRYIKDLISIPLQKVFFFVNGISLSQAAACRLLQS